MSALAIVAIDGPAGSGKSTVARAVAARLDRVYVDTGAIYRSVALAARRRGVDLADGTAVGALAGELAIAFRNTEAGQRVLNDGEDVSEAIRDPEVSMGASAVSAHAEVRAALLEQQRRLALNDAHVGGVLEGRDIGTVVFPDAGLKVFLVASVEERARRRHSELQAAGKAAELNSVIAELRERDHNDETRAHAPLRQAADAVLLDTTRLSIDEVVGQIVRLARERLR